MPSAVLKMIRGNDWAYRFAKIKILIDGKSIGSLSRNETKEFEIQPGVYQVQACQQILKGRAITVPIGENQTVIFKIVIPGGETFFKNFLSLATYNGFPKPELERIRS